MPAAKKATNEIEGVIWVQRVEDDQLYMQIKLAANRVWQGGGGKPTVESVSRFMTAVKQATESRSGNAGLKLPPVPSDEVIAVALDEYHAPRHSHA